jgi:ribosome biogenesis GTPase A
MNDDASSIKDAIKYHKRMSIASRISFGPLSRRSKNKIEDTVQLSEGTDHDFAFSIGVVGETKVGKTSLINKEISQHSKDFSLH